MRAWEFRNQSPLQRLAHNVPTEADDEREDQDPLTEDTVEEAVSGNDDLTESILREMANQKEWVKSYEAFTKTACNAILQHQYEDPNDVKNRALTHAQNALRSAVNISADLYQIHTVRERAASEESEDNDSSLNQPLPDGVTRIVKRRFADRLKNQNKLEVAFTGFDEVTDYKVSLRSRGAVLPKGKALGRLADQNNRLYNRYYLGNKAKNAGTLYKKAGVISNEARLIAASAQVRINRAKQSLDGGNRLAIEAHAHSSEPNHRLRYQGNASNNLGPAIAEIDDIQGARVTTYTAFNDPLGRIPKKLHPLVADGLRQMSLHSSIAQYESYVSNTKGAGSHAEIYAANKALIGSGITRLPEAGDRLFGRISRTPLTPAGDIWTGAFFDQCPHCKTALENISKYIYKMRRKYIKKCAYYTELFIHDYAAVNPGDIWSFAEKLMSLRSWNVERIAYEIYLLTHSDDSLKNYYAAERLCRNEELLKYRLALQIT